MGEHLLTPVPDDMEMLQTSFITKQLTIVKQLTVVGVHLLTPGPNEMEMLQTIFITKNTVQRLTHIVNSNG